MRALRAAPIAAALALCSGCVAGSKIRADSEVITNDIERAKRSGAIKCAPRELANAVANRDFAVGELDRGNNFRAQDHIRVAEENIKKVECIDFAELGMEAVWKIEVVDFPAFILVDDKGNDFFKKLGV